MSENIRHKILTGADLRAMHDKPAASLMERALLSPTYILRRIPTVEGKPRKYKTYPYKDRKPYLWTLKYKDELLFNAQSSKFQTQNTELFFMHDSQNMCDMTNWKDDKQDVLFEVTVKGGGKETRVLSVTEPMIYPDETGVFHCANCHRPMGHITDVVIAVDTKQSATLVFNGKTQNYLDIIDPLLDLEALRTGETFKKAARKEHAMQTEEEDTAPKEKTIDLHHVVEEGKFRRLKEYKDRYIVDELKALFERANLSDD